MKFLILAVIALSTTAKEIGKCQVSQWGHWSQCHPSRLCNAEIPDVERDTYHLPSAKYDAGREHMNIMMKMKQEHWKAQDECQKAGTCTGGVMPSALGFTPCENGMADRYPCRNVDILSFLNPADMGYITMAPGDTFAKGNDMWGWTDPETEDEYAIMGLTGGTAFVRITNPTEPEPLAFMYTRTTASIWRDMKVIDNTAYIVSEAADHGLQVFDLLRLRSMKATQPVPTVEPDSTYSEFGNAHNIVANEETKFLYVVGATNGDYPKNCKGGLHVIDVKDRLNPQYAGCFDEDGYVHDAQCVNYHGPDNHYKGREICFCYNEDTFTIVDVHVKNNMQLVSKIGYIGYQYTHQGWLTEDHTIALMDDEMDEMDDPVKNTKTYIWDITDLANPVLKRTFFSAQEAMDHNQYVKGEYTYQANYRAGLRILHIDQQNFDLNEVAYLDTYPADTVALFNGAWSTYPYFKSGTVTASSSDYGLFVVRPNYAAMEDQKKKLFSEKTRTRSIVSCSGVVDPQLEGHLACENPVC